MSRGTVTHSESLILSPAVHFYLTSASNREENVMYLCKMSGNNAPKMNCIIDHHNSICKHHGVVFVLGLTVWGLLCINSGKN